METDQYDHPADNLTVDECAALLRLYERMVQPDGPGTPMARKHPVSAVTRLVASFAQHRYGASELPLPKSLSGNALNLWTWRFHVANGLNRFPKKLLHASSGPLRATLTVWLPDTAEWNAVEPRMLIDALLPLALSTLRIDMQRVVCQVKNLTIERVGSCERGAWAISIDDEPPVSQAEVAA